ncbi:MAG: efflux transporter outer membrane subunit [Gallionellaceae bacterium]|nr:efflux transporter outer membrane subunit [Gallionellaceae bacterium]
MSEFKQGAKAAMNHRPNFAVLLSSCLLAACTAVGPNYQRPNMELPENWPARQGATSQPFAHAGDDWWNLYADPILNRLEDEALAHNADVQVAVARVLEVRAQLGITEADQYPVVSANARESRTESSLAGAVFRPANFPRIQNSSHVTLDASYELDLWGKFKRASEASRAELLAAESAKDTARLSLTAQVAQQYFALLAIDAQESILRRVLDGRQETLVMDKKRAEVGVISEYEMHQAEAEAAAIRSQLASIVQARDRQEAALALLLGRSPREVMGGKLDRGSPTLIATWVPDGLPAELLLRRPDLKEAELHLMALNARIGVARAQFFPSIGITSYLGNESTSFARLFSGPAGIFQFAANVSQPIFNAGRIGYSVDAEEARRDQALIQYKQAVASAFADVRNALSAQKATWQAMEAESIRSQSLAQAYKQAELRSQGGITSRFEFLDIERNYLQAELTRIDAERNQRIAVSDLFKALGGGWQPALHDSKNNR